MIQILLSGDELSGAAKMDPLVSLYYYAPVCTLMNLLVALVTEVPTFAMEDVWRVGFPILFLNASVAFALNVASVFLIGKTSGLVMTLCGVLKNILLVAASILIWGTVVGGIQVVGYGIALCGLVYYGVGYEGILAYWAAVGLVCGGLWEGMKRKDGFRRLRNERDIEEEEEGGAGGRRAGEEGVRMNDRDERMDDRDERLKIVV